MDYPCSGPRSQDAKSVSRLHKVGQRLRERFSQVPGLLPVVRRGGIGPSKRPGRRTLMNRALHLCTSSMGCSSETRYRAELRRSCFDDGIHAAATPQLDPLDEWQLANRRVGVISRAFQNRHVQVRVSST